MAENHRSKLPEAQDVVGIVDELLQRAVAAGASDVHFEPTGADLKVKYRLDGVLCPVESLPAAVADNVVARLKVLGGLLTYRNDIPQEGRLELRQMTASSSPRSEGGAGFPAPGNAALLSGIGKKANQEIGGPGG